MIDMFECLPAVEHMTLWSDIIPVVCSRLGSTGAANLNNAPQMLCLKGVSYHDGYGLMFLVVLMKNSPNLEKIELEINSYHYLFRDVEDYREVYEEYHSDVWLEQLKDLKVTYISNLEIEMEFVKFISVGSPKLKKVSIKSEVAKNKESRMLKTLLRAPWASGVEIDVY